MQRLNHGLILTFSCSFRGVFLKNSDRIMAILYGYGLAGEEKGRCYFSGRQVWNVENFYTSDFHRDNGDRMW